MSTARQVGAALDALRSERDAACEAYGYDVDRGASVALADAASGRLNRRYRRPRLYGGPLVVVDVRELVEVGTDPEGVAPLAGGCYIRALTWHAQFGTSGRPEHALRIDLDRRGAPGHPTIHRHPLGKPNEVREELPALPIFREFVGAVEMHAAEITAI